MWAYLRFLLVEEQVMSSIFNRIGSKSNILNFSIFCINFSFILTFCVYPDPFGKINNFYVAYASRGGITGILTEMTNTIYKSTSFLTMALATFGSNAALYRVVEVGSPTTTEESYGIAVDKESGTTDCFSTSCSDDEYSIAGDTKNGTDGFSFKEEVPFAIDNRFYYLDYDDLESYCDEELGYSTCEAWAERHWYGNTDTDIGGLENEREAYYETSYASNATAFYAYDTYTFEPDMGSNSPFK